jgi:hypothetical protein
MAPPFGELGFGGEVVRQQDLRLDEVERIPRVVDRPAGGEVPQRPLEEGRFVLFERRVGGEVDTPEVNDGEDGGGRAFRVAEGNGEEGGLAEAGDVEEEADFGGDGEDGFESGGGEEGLA